MFKKSIIVTLSNETVHFSFKKHTVAIPMNVGFSYDRGYFKPADDTPGFECSESEFNKIRSRYHRALKGKSNPHKIWALAFTVTAMWGLAVVPVNGDRIVEEAYLDDAALTAPETQTPPTAGQSESVQGSASSTDYLFPNS